MSIPDKVKIGAIEYPVRQDSDDQLAKDELLGECGYHEPYIKVLSTLPQERKQQTFIHELTHVLLFEAGFAVNTYNNERIVRPLANMLYQVLLDNRLTFHD